MAIIIIMKNKGIILTIMCLFLLGSALPIMAVIQEPTSYYSFGNKNGAYHTYSEMTDLLFHIAANHSDIMKVTSQGITYQGRDIWSVKLSDNVDVDEDEPAILLLGAHHGNEKPSFESLIFFIEYMASTYDLENYDNDMDGLINEDIIDGIDNDDDGLIDEDPSEDRVRNVIDNTKIYIVPMVNPDGVEAGVEGTRKNCAPNYGRFGHRSKITSYGVDLNRNYDYRWFLYYVLPIQYHLIYHSNDKSFNYRGEHPFSEEESQAVKNLVENDDNIKVSLSYHSYGEFIIFPWTHTSMRTPDEVLFNSVAEGITNINGYNISNGWRNYIIPRFKGSLGTSENWLYGEKGILSFTVELCKTRAPTDPEVIFDYCMKHVGVNMYVAEQTSEIETTIIPK